MKRKYQAIRWLLVGLLPVLILSCSADNSPPSLAGSNPSSTGPAPVAATGQDRCFNSDGLVVDCGPTGQDGDLQKGVHSPNPRFTDNGDGTVTDNLTGLMWMKEADCIGNIYPSFDVDEIPGDGLVYWQTGLDFAQAVNSGTYDCNVTTTYADWRVPNLDEMMSLLNYKVMRLPSSAPLPPVPLLTDTAGTGPWSSGDPFTGLAGSYYTSTSAPSSATSWVVSVFGTVSKGAKTGYEAGVWLVRTSSIKGPAPVPATGQTSCYDASGDTIDCAGTGQDGELQTGIPIPAPRFTDNHDGTVTDNLTGLMWMKEANCIGNLLPELDRDGEVDGAVTWQHGLDFIAGLNYGAHDCGATKQYTDWRLPNLREMDSLIDINYSWPPLSDNPFTGVHVGIGGGWSYEPWVSTSYNDHPEYVNFIDFREGTINLTLKSKQTDTMGVWPVRGGK